MTRDKDDQWIDAVAGRPAPSLNQAERRLADAVRQVVRARHQQTLDTAAESELTLQRVLSRVRVPTRSRAKWAVPFGLAAAAILAVGLVVRVGLQPDRSTPDQLRGGAGVQIIETDDAKLTAAQIVKQLSAAGIDVQSYPLGAYSGVNATVPADKRSLLAPMLEKLGVRIPQDGVLRIEIRQK